MTAFQGQMISRVCGDSKEGFQQVLYKKKMQPIHTITIGYSAAKISVDQSATFKNELFGGG